MAVVVREEIDAIQIEEFLSDSFNSFDAELYQDNDGMIRAKIFDRVEDDKESEHCKLNPCTYSETGCSDCKENQSYLKGQDDGLYAERNRVLQIIHYVDLNCFDPTGEIHDKLDVVREKIISGNVIEDYQNV